MYCIIFIYCVYIAYMCGCQHFPLVLQTFAFSTSMVPFPIAKTDSLDRVMHKSSRFAFGGTDCAAPMVYARKHGMDVDAFIVLTDSETCAPLLCT